MLKKVMARYHLTFMRQRALSFIASDLLHVYTVVQSKNDPNTNLLKGKHYLRLRNPKQPHIKLVTEILDKDLFVDEFVWSREAGNSEP